MFFAGLAGIVSSHSLILSLLGFSTFPLPTTLCLQCRDQVSLLGLNRPADLLRYIFTASITTLLSCSHLPFISLAAGSHLHGRTRWPFTHPRAKILLTLVYMKRCTYDASPVEATYQDMLGYDDRSKSCEKDVD